MRGDIERRNENIDSGRKLCDHCDGTGNEMFSMYRKCPHCDGKGTKPEICNQCDWREGSVTEFPCDRCSTLKVFGNMFKEKEAVDTPANTEEEEREDGTDG